MMKSLVMVLVALVPWLTSHQWFPAVCKALTPMGITLMEDVRIPEEVIDFFMRPALRLGFVALVQDLESSYYADVELPLKYSQKLREMPIAIYTPDANEQHYEVETQFFDIALGKRKKYSAGLWDVATTDVKSVGGPGLEASEDAMLDLYAKRAGIKDGMTLLDLGCGWGSVSLYMAEHFPNARIIGVSNSRTQRKYIMETAERRGFKNVEIHTMNVASPEFETFVGGLSLDRIISIEMFEHMKNYPELLRRLSTALKPGGKLFLHFFCHKFLPYDFREDDLNAWMTRHFFKGGTMPSQYLLTGFQEHLRLENQWNVNGMNYWLTSEAWLQRMDAKRPELLKVFGGADSAEAKLQLRRWRIFMIAVAEFFRFRQGTEFFVTHMLFTKPQ